jgi:hypothetical protein
VDLTLYEGKQMLRAMDCYMNLNQKMGFKPIMDQEEEETILVTTMSFTFGFFLIFPIL